MIVMVFGVIWIIFLIVINVKGKWIEVVISITFIKKNPYKKFHKQDRPFWEDNFYVMNFIPFIVSLEIR